MAEKYPAIAKAINDKLMEQNNSIEYLRKYTNELIAENTELKAENKQLKEKIEELTF
ncbi:MAG: hypothetical protein J6A43_03610 [Clostridia bacterium]|nr:hypothetical protein [Clostridia bacterium]